MRTLPITRSQTHPRPDLPLPQAQLLDASLFREVKQFPSFNTIKDGDLYALSLGVNTTEYTHGLHRFPAKFIPQIPRWALREFVHPGACVLDPYMGSGTTLVEAIVLGCHGIGTDIDPLARLIARAKTDEVSSGRLAHLRGEIRERWDVNLHGKPESLRPPMPDIDNFEHWFSRTTWRDLATLRDALADLACLDAERTLLRAIFSSILRRVSNADDQSQKTYVSGTLRKHPPGVPETFWRSFERALCGVRELENARHPQAICQIYENGDATRLPLPAHSVDLIVTSPPYLDSVDYMYNLMAEYFWMGPLIGFSTRQDLNKYRRRPTGAKNPVGKDIKLPDSIRDLVNCNDLKPGRARAANAYFRHMQSHFAEAARVLKPGARYVLVVGNSQTQTKVLPVHECLLRLAREAGFHLEKVFGMRVRRHHMKFPRKGRGGIIVMDWILILRRCDNPCFCPVTPDSMPLPLPWFTLPQDAVAY